MKRRIVQHGSSSLTVTLPIKWVKKLNLGKGDEIDVHESADQLVISAKKQPSLARKVVDTREFGKFRKNDLSHLYLLGYDEIEIAYDGEATLKEIQKAVPECIGFEIMNQTSKRVYIKSIAPALEQDFEILLRKAFQVTNEMAKSMLEAVEANKFSELKELRHLEKINNKFTLCCGRILVKHNYVNPERTPQIYELVKNLEKLADRYKYICDVLSDHKGALPAPVLSFFRDVNAYYLEFYELFYKFDPHKKEFIYRKKDLLARGMALLKKPSTADISLIHHLMDIVSLTFDLCGSYLALIS